MEHNPESWLFVGLFIVAVVGVLVLALTAA